MRFLSVLHFDEAWLELRGAVHSDPVASFGQKVGSILDAYLTKLFRVNILWKSNLLKMKTTILHSRTIFYDALNVGLSDIGKVRLLVSGFDGAVYAWDMRVNNLPNSLENLCMHSSAENNSFMIKLLFM